MSGTRVVVARGPGPEPVAVETPPPAGGPSAGAARPSVRARTAGAAALAVAAASLSLGPAFEDAGWFWPSLAAIAAVATSGMAARALRAPALLVVAAQAATLAVVVAHQAADALAWLGWLPGPSAAARVVDVLAAALDEVGQVAPPAPTSPALVALAVAGLGATALVVDALAVTGRWAAAAGLPLLAVYAVPAAVVPGGVPWPLFALGAVGYLVLLLADSRQRLLAWGESVGARPGPRAPAASATPPLGAMGRRIGLTAIAAAVLAPLLLPFLGDAALDLGPGSGAGGSGGRTVATVNPLVSLQRDLTRVDDSEVLRYTTSARSPDYLRMVTLDAYDGTQWQPAVLRTKAGAQVSDGLPPAPGLADEVRRATVTTTLEVGPLAENRLPLPYPATRVDIDGDWRYDEPTRNVLTPDQGRTTAGESYTVTSLQLAPTASQLRAAGAAPNAPARYTELPPVTALAGQLAQQAAGSAATPYDQALALQAWFRSGEFSYDTSPQPRSDDPLADFLVDRRGYCQQFAGAFAVMARTLGIPARVNVGFAPGSPDGREWVVTWNDTHAWPELYFEGVGWVRFEPTPGNAGAGVSAPAYAPFAGSGGSEPSAAPSPAAPSANPSPSSTAGARERPDVAGTSTAARQAASRRGLLLAALALAVVAAAPATRAWRRRRRLAAAHRGSAEAAWAEVLDTADDLRQGLAGDAPAGSPRAQVAALGLDGPAGDAARRLGLAVERARFARDPGAPAPRDGDVRVVVTALRGRASRRRRATAAYWPRSVVRVVGTARQSGYDVLDRADARWQRATRRAGARASS